MLKRSVLFLFINLFINLSVLGNPSYQCDSQYKNQEMTQIEIDKILQKNMPHKGLNFCGAKFHNLDLSNQDLSHFNFTGASFNNTDLSYSNLMEANFNQSTIHQSNLLYAYARWAQLSHAKFENSNLEQANLSDAQMQNAHFNDSNFLKTNFSNSQLNDSTFRLSKLVETNFSHANLKRADFRLSQGEQVSFSYAQLTQADLTEFYGPKTNFESSDLTQVSFQNANLAESNFTHAILEQTDFMRANLLNSIYKPNLVGLPLLSNLAAAQNFNTIQFYDQTLKGLPLTALKSAYQKAGFRSMERLITSMVKTEEMKSSLQSGGLDQVRGVLSFIFFYLSCEFGLKPIRPLLIFLAILFLMALPYRIALSQKNKHHGIHIQWYAKNKKELIDFELGSLSYYKSFKNRAHYEWVQWQRAFYFSLLSAFKIGWEDFNIANWIQQMQQKEFDLKGTGRIKTLAGLQALIGIYLLVLWVMTYFGRPFEW